MNRRQTHVLLAIPALTECLQSYVTAYRHVPGFVEQVALYRSLAQKAQATGNPGEESSDAPAGPVHEAREALIQTVQAVSGPLEAWAAIIGNEMLRYQVSSNPDELRAMGPAVIEHARALGEIGHGMLEQGAAHYGLSHAALIRLEAEIKLCEDLIAQSEEISPPLRSAEDQLFFFLRDVMDPLVRGFLLSAPEFHAAYDAARKTGKTGPGQAPERAAQGDAILNA